MPRDRAFAGPGPDVLLYAPADELTGTEIVVDQLTARPNPYGGAPAQKPKRRRRRVSLEHAALDLYGGHDGLLVRTALIRSKDYSDRDLPEVQSAHDVAKLCRHLIYSDSEYMVTIAMDNAMRVRAIHEAALGPANAAAFTAQQVLKVAFLTSAQQFVMVHNHPSGTPSPSNDDLSSTVAVAEAARCVGLSMMDHVIVAERGFFSFQWYGANFDNPQSVIGLRGEDHFQRWPK